MAADSSSAGSIFPSTLAIERIMNGSSTCTMPTVTDQKLFMRGSGSRVRPRPRRTLFTSPSLPSTMVQPIVRTTIDTSSGEITPRKIQCL